MTLSNPERYSKSLSFLLPLSLLLQISFVFRSSGSQISIACLTFVEMTKGGKSDAVSSAGKGKATVEKGKRSSHRTRVGMGFDSKTTTLHNQKEIDEYLAKYGVELSWD